MVYVLEQHYVLNVMRTFRKNEPHQLNLGSTGITEKGLGAEFTPMLHVSETWSKARLCYRDLGGS